MKLFTYGSLMDTDIFTLVAGEEAVCAAATLNGYRRLAVAGEDYPGMIEAEGHCVEGQLYSGLSATALARLDEFEGECYRREVVSLICDGESIAAEAYVVRPQFHGILAEAEWDWAHFQREGKARFQQRYVGFNRHSQAD